MTLYRVTGRDTGVPSLNDTALAGAAFGATVDLTLDPAVEAELLDAGLIEIVLPDAGLAAITSVVYDAAGNITAMTEGGTVTTYTYDASGNALTETRGGFTRTFTYDASGNLTGATVA